jgi:UDP-glucose 4-epimerase
LNLLDGKKAFVTGGIGFIGSHLADALLGRGCEVTCYDVFDDFYPGKESNAKLLQSHPKFCLIRGDILDYSSLSSAMKDCEVVFHEAGQAGIRYCNEKPMKANKVNVEGTLNVLMAARERGIKRVVYASSSSIFGDPLYLPIDEQHPTRPNSPYGVSKLAGELYCLAFGKVYGLEVPCLRYFSVYGPRGRPDQVIYAFAEKVSRGESPTIYGDGTQTRDFTFISDVVHATLLAAEKDEAGGETFNIGHGSKISMNELTSKVISAMGREGQVSPVYRERSKGDFHDTEANNEKARKLLGWNPKVTLDVGLRSFLDWFECTRAVELAKAS